MNNLASFFKQVRYFILGALYFPVVILLDLQIALRPYQNKILYFFIPGLLIALFLRQKKALVFSAGLLTAPLGFCIFLLVFASSANRNAEENLPILNKTEIISKLEDYKTVHGNYPPRSPDWLHSRYRDLEDQREVALAYDPVGLDFEICIYNPEFFGGKRTCYSSMNGKWKDFPEGR